MNFWAGRRQIDLSFSTFFYKFVFGYFYVMFIYSIKYGHGNLKVTQKFKQVLFPWFLFVNQVFILIAELTDQIPDPIGMLEIIHALIWHEDKNYVEMKLLVFTIFFALTSLVAYLKKFHCLSGKSHDHPLT